MSWMQMLCQTYENNSCLAGKDGGEFAALSLVSHMTANAQLEITVSEQGDFLSAIEVPKNDSATIIPITEKSASRSSGIAPHPLCDTLSYTAGDYADYVSGEKEKKKAADKFKAYSEALNAWVNSEYTHPKIKAVYAYISRACMMSDLVKCGIVKLTADGVLEGKKIQGSAYEKALVRFRVVTSSSESVSNAVWEDGSLFDSFTKYYLSVQGGKKDICYINGISEASCTNHPNGIIAANCRAKLISSNDMSGFTFRGRFDKPEEAYSVSYEATQKAHNALTWLAKNQGISIGNQDKRTYICWNPRGKPVPSIDSPLDIDDDEPEEIIRPLTEPEYAERLSKAFKGYSDTLDDNDDIIIMALDAATTGRLSVTYYNELKASCFLTRFKNWAQTCRWYFPVFTQDENGKRLHYEIKSPLAKRTIEYAFGSQQDKFVKVGDKLLKEQYQRIIHCMFDEMPVPRDIVHALAKKASNPVAYSFTNYENVLSTACAYIAKYYYDKGVIISMNQNDNSNDRNVIFGELLALTDYYEYLAMRIKQNPEDRPTNAQKLMLAYSSHPAHVYKIIREKLQPYLLMMPKQLREKCEDNLSKTASRLDINDKNLNSFLDVTYLIAYSKKRLELRGKNKEDE